MTVKWAVQTMDGMRGETEWSTVAPVRRVQVEATTAETAAREIYGRRRLRFLHSMRGRVAVWLNPAAEVPLGTEVGTPPDAVYERTED